MENMLDVLIYLFENYLGTELDDHSQRSTLGEELKAAGFPSRVVENAFDWLEGLRLQRELPLPSPSEGGLRLYVAEECQLIPTECRGFLLHLEHLGILNPQTRESVIDRLMTLALRDRKAEMVTLNDLKWIVLMVLFNQPKEPANGNTLNEFFHAHETTLLH